MCNTNCLLFHMKSYICFGFNLTFILYFGESGCLKFFIALLQLSFFFVFFLFCFFCSADSAPFFFFLKNTFWQIIWIFNQFYPYQSCFCSRFFFIIIFHFNGANWYTNTKQISCAVFLIMCCFTAAVQKIKLIGKKLIR